MIEDLRTVDSNDVFKLKPVQSEDYPSIAFELVIKGLETRLNIELIKNPP